ncbi:MAG: hypothetical protein IT512_06600 [Rhodocyclaceae bacterium]|nr:hypothetical protein [Rhodocyclaceae bacterium]
MAILGVPIPRSQLFKVCEYRKCRKRFRVTPSEFHRRRFCSLSCAAHGNHGNTGGPRKTFATSTSGVAGICLIKWNASWATYMQVGDKRKQRSFAIRKYGYSGAWRQAANVRAEQTGFKIPVKPPMPPAWLRKWAKSQKIELV